MNEDQTFSLYNSQINKDLNELWEYDDYIPYRFRIIQITNYIRKLEDTIYNYTE